MAFPIAIMAAIANRLGMSFLPSGPPEGEILEILIII